MYFDQSACLWKLKTIENSNTTSYFQANLLVFFIFYETPHIFQRKQNERILREVASEESCKWIVSFLEKIPNFRVIHNIFSLEIAKINRRRKESDWGARECPCNRKIRNRQNNLRASPSFFNRGVIQSAQQLHYKENGSKNERHPV